MSISLSWVEVTIPDSTPPVSVARLREEPDGAFWAFVRFPRGWSRPVTGHYLVDEDFWLLEGELTMNGQIYGLEQGARIAAGERRSDSRADQGALALARFSGPARWVRD